MQAAQDKEQVLQPPWQQCQQPLCQQGVARAAAVTGWPRCRHRVNPEWLVRRCRDLA